MARTSLQSGGVQLISPKCKQFALSIYYQINSSVNYMVTITLLLSCISNRQFETALWNVTTLQYYFATFPLKVLILYLRLNVWCAL